MHILITGGTGFIGSRLALRCLERGHAVQVLGQERNAAEAENRRQVEAAGAQIISASVTDRENVFRSLQNIELVYHLAAAQHEANVPDQYFWDVNVTGTRNVLEGSINAGVKRFIHGSTIGVYGSALGGRLDEDSPLQPDNIYGITKLEGEKLVQSFQEKIPAVIIRISETYGLGDRRLLKLFRTIQKGIFVMIGDGTNTHHLIYIDDLIEGLCLAATATGAVGKTFVLAGKEAVTTNEMVVVIAEQLGRKISKVRLPLSPLWGLATTMEAVLRPLGIRPPLHRRRMDFFKKNFMFSQERSREILRFVPRVGFRQGVAETARWYHERGEI